MDRFTTIRRLSLFVVAVAGGCASLRRGPVADHVLHSRQLTQQAQVAIHQQRWDDAENTLVQAIERCPKDANARQCLAEVLWNRGASEAAVEQLTRALELTGNNQPELIVRLGRMQLAQDDLIGALRSADQAIQINGRHASAWELRGEVLRRQNQFGPALASYYRALSEYGTSAYSRLQIAEIPHLEGRPRRAIAVLEGIDDVQALGELQQRVYLLKGLAFESLDRPAAAVRELVAARSAGPATPELLYHLASAQLATGQLAEAQWSAEKAIETAGAGQEPPLRELLARIAAARQSTEQVWR